MRDRAAIHLQPDLRSGRSSLRIAGDDLGERRFREDDIAESFIGVVEYEGLQELYRALQITEPQLANELKVPLYAIGELVRKDAEERFKPDEPALASQYDAFEKTGRGFRTRVRASGRYGILQLEQSIPRTTGQHPEYGALMVTRGLLPARESHVPETVELLERDVVSLLHNRGF
jgi:hypothetical protein